MEQMTSVIQNNFFSMPLNSEKKLPDIIYMHSSFNYNLNLNGDNDELASIDPISDDNYSSNGYLYEESHCPSNPNGLNHAHFGSITHHSFSNTNINLMSSNHVANIPNQIQNQSPIMHGSSIGNTSLTTITSHIPNANETYNANADIHSSNVNFLNLDTKNIIAPIPLPQLQKHNDLFPQKGMGKLAMPRVEECHIYEARQHNATITPTKPPYTASITDKLVAPVPVTSNILQPSFYQSPYPVEPHHAPTFCPVPPIVADLQQQMPPTCESEQEKVQQQTTEFQPQPPHIFRTRNPSFNSTITSLNDSLNRFSPSPAVSPIYSLQSCSSHSDLLSQPTTPFQTQSPTSFMETSLAKLSSKSNKSQRKRKLLRSTRGCWTCRIKHLKCDEATPVCNRCFRFGIECDYSTTKPLYVTDEALRKEKLVSLSIARKCFRVKTKKHL